MRLGPLAAGCLLLTGCGTVASLVRPEDGSRVFGGVRRDMNWFGQILDGPADPNGPLSASSSGKDSAIFAALFIAAPLIDLPLSFAADVLAFPLARWLDER